jgi:hypothetical protein
MRWKRHKSPWLPGYRLGAVLESPDGSREFHPFCADDVPFCAVPFPHRHCGDCSGPVATGILNECPRCRGTADDDGRGP